MEILSLKKGTQKDGELFVEITIRIHHLDWNEVNFWNSEDSYTKSFVKKLTGFILRALGGFLESGFPKIN